MPEHNSSVMRCAGEARIFFKQRFLGEKERKELGDARQVEATLAKGAADVPWGRCGVSLAEGRCPFISAYSPGTYWSFFQFATHRRQNNGQPPKMAAS